MTLARKWPLYHSDAAYGDQDDDVPPKSIAHQKPEGSNHDAQKLQVEPDRDRRMAVATARRVAADLRNAPPLDPNRRQNSSQARAIRQPLVALRALRDAARFDDVGNALRSRHHRARIRFSGR